MPRTSLPAHLAGRLTVSRKRSLIRSRTCPFIHQLPGEEEKEQQKPPPDPTLVPRRGVYDISKTLKEENRGVGLMVNFLMMQLT